MHGTDVDDGTDCAIRIITFSVPHVGGSVSRSSYVGREQGREVLHDEDGREQ